MSYRQVLRRGGTGLPVGGVCFIRGRILFGASLVLRNVTVVVALHFGIEDLRLTLGGLWDEVLHQLEELVANLVQFSLHPFPILCSELRVFLIALRSLLLLDARDDPPGRT